MDLQNGLSPEKLISRNFLPLYPANQIQIDNIKGLGPTVHTELNSRNISNKIEAMATAQGMPYNFT